MSALAKTLTRVYFHDGTWSSFRGRTHGRQVDVFRVPAHRFLGYLQNHDQVGNRATGDRISATLPADLLKVGAGLVLWRGRLRVAVNLGSAPATVPLGGQAAALLAASRPGIMLNGTAVTLPPAAFAVVAT